VRFEVAQATEFSGRYDLVLLLDCLHDMGDPAAACRHIHKALYPEGTLIVDPLAGDRLEDNLTPLGRAYYAASTLNCVPTSLSQPGGLALGAQAGEARLREEPGRVQSLPQGCRSAVQPGDRGEAIAWTKHAIGGPHRRKRARR
jgi:hypothetical protein